MLIAAKGGLFRHALLAGAVLCFGLITQTDLVAQNNSAPFKDLKDQIDALKGKLTAEAAKDSGVRDKLGELIQTGLVDEDSFKAVLSQAGIFLEKNGNKLHVPVTIMDGTRELITKVRPVIKGFPKSALSPTTFKNLKDQVAPAATEASNIEVDLDRDAAARRQMDVLRATISDPTLLDVTDKELQAAAMALARALDGIAPGEFRINVLGAWYGDLDVIHYNMSGLLKKPFKDDWRLCSATRVVRTHCQAKDVCVFPTETSAPQAQVNGDSLCGYDPVMFAAIPLKGLVIQFECIPLLSNLWNSAPADQPKRLKTDEEPNEAILRATNKTELRCQPAKPAPPAKAAVTTGENRT